MAVLLAVLDDHADVEWNLFGLIDDDRTEPGEPSWASLGSPRTMLTGKNGAIFRSGGGMHRAAVRLESWSAPAPAPDGEWDAVREDEIPLTSGLLRLAFVASGASFSTLQLPGPGTYAMRVSCRGRDAALTAGSLPYTEDVFEHWVMQFWPSR